MEKKNVSVVAGLIYAGIAFLGLGLLGNLLFFLPEVVNYARWGHPDPLIGKLIAASNVSFLLGMVLVVAGIITGICIKSVEKTAPGQIIHDCRILSRFAINDVGEMVFSDWEDYAPGGKLYIQLELPTNKTRELRTSWQVFLMCGEGMVGSVYLDGDWISSFVPRKVESNLPQSPPTTLNDWHQGI